MKRHNIMSQNVFFLKSNMDISIFRKHLDFSGIPYRSRSSVLSFFRRNGIMGVGSFMGVNMGVNEVYFPGNSDYVKLICGYRIFSDGVIYNGR